MTSDKPRRGKPGRPPVHGEARLSVLAVRVTAAELEAVSRQAEAAGKPRGVYVHELLERAGAFRPTSPG